MVVRKAVWDEKGERKLKQGNKSEQDRYANLRNDPLPDEGLGQVCADCGHDIPLSDVTGQYKGKCAKCREEEQMEKDLEQHRNETGYYTGGVD